ncbi:MAG: peptide deformylase [Aureispira sp.]
MKLPIYAYGHPILRKETEEIEDDYPNLSKLIDDMFETMYHTKGMGLAAPQIGRNIRLFLVDTEQLDREEREEDASEFIREVFINPIILDESGKKWEYEEGCLSIPDIRGNVARAPKVRIEYYDANFELQDKIFDGITARVIQHEYDHLEGVLFVDLLKPLKKRFVQKRLDKIKNGKIGADYKLVFAHKKGR